jgi:putative acetyltransferase
MNIRPEQDADKNAVYAVNAAAFPGNDEAELVNTLREAAQPLISLVAEDKGCVVGHILFTPVSLDDDDSLTLMGLAPMAVLPKYQKQGIGTALVETGLTNCERLGAGAVVVLGHPEYYSRFGFVPALSFGIKSEYDVPAEVFMIKELQADYLADKNGTIVYHNAFSEL